MAKKDKSKKTVLGEQGIYDARVLGKPKMMILGFQHTFAMFGATVLVPLLTGLNMQTTLLMAGLGTLFFHLVTKFKVPAFLAHPSRSSADMPLWLLFLRTAPRIPKCCLMQIWALCAQVLFILCSPHFSLYSR